MNTLLIVTGASRGIGRAISVAFSSPEWQSEISSLRAILIARSEEGLAQTKSLMLQEASKKQTPIGVSCYCIDLSNLEQLEEKTEQIFASMSTHKNDYPRRIFINNAGNVGPLDLTASICSVEHLRQAMDLNVTSGLFLSSRFAHYFCSSNSSSDKEKDDSANSSSSVVVNISSLCAIQPFPTMGVYCATKAARDMYHAVMAQELSNVKILNYAPGACDTDMQDELRNAETFDKQLRDYYVKAKESNELVKVEDTAKKLVQLVMQSNFDSGSHIDYWDV